MAQSSTSSPLVRNPDIADTTSCFKFRFHYAPVRKFINRLNFHHELKKLSNICRLSCCIRIFHKHTKLAILAILALERLYYVKTKKSSNKMLPQ